MIKNIDNTAENLAIATLKLAKKKAAKVTRWDIEVESEAKCIVSFEANIAAHAEKLSSSIKSLSYFNNTFKVSYLDEDKNETPNIMTSGYIVFEV